MFAGDQSVTTTAKRKKVKATQAVQKNKSVFENSVLQLPGR